MQAHIGMHLLERTDAIERLALDTAELEMQKMFPFNLRACSSCCRDDLNSQYGKGPMLRQSVLRHAIEWNALDTDIRCLKSVRHIWYISHNSIEDNELPTDNI